MRPKAASGLPWPFVRRGSCLDLKFAALDFLGGKHCNHSCRGVAKFYSIQLLSGETARNRDIAPVIRRVFLFVRRVGFGRRERGNFAVMLKR